LEGRFVRETAGVIVELFGVPRLRAGRAEACVPAGTVAEVLAALERACPGLAGLRRPDGSPAPHYLLSLDGGTFLADPDRRLRDGERLVILSADAGG
jgi:molybdopterin converting factor small subunit